MLDKTYRPGEVEPRRYSKWEETGAFAAHEESNATPYAIMMPPPNVTGSLHMGHALTFTLQDVLIRYNRMKGRDTLWQPGTDHAGIATQMVVERQLGEQGKTRHDLGRQKFLERVWEWKAESGGTITRQLRRLGASPDWARERFTMDPGLNLAVRKVFVELHRAGLIYRDKRLVNWDPKLHTAISDLEVEQREVTGNLWYLRYPIEGETDKFITVATTRPETMLGDTAVAVHPEDERYKNLIGKKVRLPIADRLIPIVADEHSDPTKGSGAVKITPAHDFNDFEVGKRHNLLMINIFDKDAKIVDSEFSDVHWGHRAPDSHGITHADEDGVVGAPTIKAIPERYRGMDRFDARKKIVAEFEELGLLEKIEPNAMTMPHGDRSGVVIEPWLTDQWYVNAEKLAQPAIKAVEEGRTRFVPQQWENTYYQWMRNIQPWCISRQLWWGHQIPAWYAPDGLIFVAMSEGDAKEAAKKHYGKDVELKQDEDVLDTWFSSALWPFSTLGWPDETKALKRYYPGDVLVTGFDIIFFWVARMMMMGMHFMGDVPFREIYIHALVRDERGQKMSKSKGNIIDPLDLIDKYGCDALRFTLSALAAPGRDIKLAESRVEGYRNFATKIWNAARFCEMNECKLVPGFDPTKSKETLNRWIASKLTEAAQSAARSLDVYRFDDAANNLYSFVWNSFCDWYLEFAKPILQGGDTPARAETRATAAWVFDTILHLLHPLMPFITEELSERLGEGVGKDLITARWPELSYIDAAATSEMDWLVRLISGVRAVRSEMNVPLSAKINILVGGASDETAQRLTRHNDAIVTMARAGIVERVDQIPAKGALQLVLDEITIALPLADVVDLGQEKARLGKEIAKLADEIGKIDKKLGNEAFIAKAKPEVIEEQRDRLAEANAARGKLVEALERLAKV